MAFASWIRNWKRSVERRWALSQTLRRKASGRRRVTRPRLEALEDRWLLSTTYTVTSGGDTNTTGTLRFGINQANLGNYTEIDFNIGGGGAQTISLTSQLPALTAYGVFINGLSQGGSGNTTKLITLDGTNAGSGSDGLLLQGSSDTVSGIIIQNFAGNGIEVAGSTTATTIGGTTAGAGNILSGNGNDGLLIDSGASGNQVLGNYIGINAGGAAQANSGNGVEIAGTGNTIGGTTSRDRNILSGNSQDGVLIDSTASGNQVLGNFIGVGISGSNGVGNVVNGIEIAGSSNTIGGTAYGSRNILSGNSQDGVLIDSSGSGNQVMGNTIGVNVSGTVGVANLNGIEVKGTGNTLGGTVSGSFNVISGNSNDGVLIDSSATGNLVEGNNIGLTVFGNAALGNSVGIEVYGNSNTLGDSYGVAPNTISGNSGDGVLIHSGASVNQVLGNYIGTNSGGTSAVANKVGIEDAGSSNTIGGSVLGDKNVISGNSGDGMLLDSTATAESLWGNYIGLNVNGTIALANGSNGVEVKGTGNADGGDSGSNYFYRNLISGNGHDGVLIDSGATGNQVQGNFIGVDVSGTNGVGNAANGIEIAGSSNTIGGTSSGYMNVFSSSGKDGILLDSMAANNLVQGNYVGTEYTGQDALANTGNGVEIAGTGNTIGGTASGAGNILSGNSKDGVRLDFSASGNLLQGNFIGINYSSAALGNGDNGVEIVGSSNSIGGSVSGAGNTIASNSYGGVLVSFGAGNTIRQNSIYANGTSSTGPGIQLSNGANHSLAAPSLTTVTINGNSLTVQGSFNATTANANYVLEFFANPTGDAESKIYVGSKTVTPSSIGTQNFTFTTTTTVTGTDPLITATLTDPSGDTSEDTNTALTSLYVLDMNTGETVPVNATLNTFSNWSEDLLAQTAGVTVTSYSWNVSQAPDFTVSGTTTTANLQGAWTSFTGSAHTDTISVTETPQSGSPLTQTITFLVAGNDSPAYSSNRPTTSSTWPTVITPDQLSSGQATQAAGPYASIGLGDGSVQTSFSMPSYNPNTTPVSLDYNSTTANAQPIFLTEYQLPLGTSVPSTITAQLTFNRTALATVTYNTSGLNPGDIMQIALQANATTLSTGRYPWSITVTNDGTPTTYSGNVDIVNQTSSPYGAGWSLDNVEQLVTAGTTGVILVNPDGTSLWYASNGSGGYTTPAGSFATLTYSSGEYTLTMPDGTQNNFSSGGQETSSVDRDGNTTSFAYNSFGGVISITDMNHQVTTLTYNSSNLLTSITDPASRAATLSYSGNQLASITDPGSDIWTYGYDSANDLTMLTDPNSHTTTFVYNSADRVSSVTQPDSTTENLTAVQMNGWAVAGSSNVTATLLAAGDEALFTDASSDNWTTGLDWLGFGEDTADIDPLGDTSLNYINTNGSVWMSADALGRPTVDFFDGNGNVTEEVAPDDTTQQYQYNSFSEVTQYTDQEDHITTYAYNSKGDLTQETDALHDVTSYAYNSAGLVTSTTDPNTNTTTYAYNSLNELTSTTNPLQGVTSYSYDNAGNLSRMIDPLSFSNTYDYNALDRMTQETLADTTGHFSTYTYAYDNVGNQTSVTDPLTHTTTYEYNAVNEQTSVTNPLDQTMTYGYNAVGELTSVTDPDPLDDQTTYGYNSAGEQTIMTDPMGDKTGYGYDAAGEQTSILDPVGNVTDYSYNTVGEMSSQSLYNPSGALVQQINDSYDADGNLLSTAMVNLNMQAGSLNAGTKANVSGSYTGTLGGSFSGTFSSSFSGNIVNSADQAVGAYTVLVDGTISGTLSGVGAISGTDSGTVAVTLSGGLSGSSLFSFSNDNFLGTNKGGSGTISGFLPFALSGNINSSGYASGTLGNSLSLTFSGGGGTYGPVSGTFSGVAGEQTSYSYNALGEQTSVTDALGHVASYSYDADGNVSTVTDADGNTTSTTYNGLNEPVSVTNQTCGCAGMSGTTTYDYNKRGEQISVTDPSDNVTSYSYDGQGRELMETAPNTGVISYSYDLAGNQTSETDPDGNTTTYAYDAANELTSTTEPQAASHPATNAYNAAGELTSATDPDGRTITYAYDKAGRQTGETWVGGNYTATYNYNANSELTSVSDPYSTYTYTYNALGQQTSVSNAGTADVPTVTLTYGYDDFGNRTSLTDGRGGSISYTYNGDNEMTSLGLSVTGTLDAQVALAYDGAGNVTGMTQTAPSASGAHALGTSYSYNHSNELTNIKYMDTTAGTTLANYTYGYNPAGVLTSYQDNSGNSLTYGYDANTELTSATGTLAGASYTFTYNYDHNGNRTSTSTDVNGTLTSAAYTLVTGSNELKSDGTYSYTYDNNGNMLTQTSLQTGSVTYYSWDYENRLTEVTVKNSSGLTLTDEKFTYDVFGNRIGVSLNGSQQLYTVYDGSNPYIDFNGSGALTERYLTNPNGLNQFYGQVSGGGTTEWFVTDNLGSVRQVVATNGNVLDAITYDPYGGIITQTNSANAPRFLYTGAAYDPITGTYLDGAREDNPEDGRWLSQDPLSFAAGDSNLYRYVGNDPTNAMDPSGEYSWSEIWSGIWSPIQASKGKAAADEAFKLAPQAAMKIGVSGTAHNGPEDALRHAIWNALMAQRIGATRAKEFADAHESNSDNKDETLMDLWNNAVGRKIGAANPNASPERIVELVLEAYMNGELRVLRKTGSGRVPDGTPLLPSGEVVTPGAKPSDPASCYYYSPYRAKPPAGGRDTRPYRYPGSPYKVGPPP